MEEYVNNIFNQFKKKEITLEQAQNLLLEFHNNYELISSDSFITCPNCGDGFILDTAKSINNELKLYDGIKYQPKFRIGQEVEYSVKTKDDLTGLSFVNKIIAYISVIRACGTSEKDSYQYGITTDLPKCCYSGESPFTYIFEDDVVLVKKN